MALKDWSPLSAAKKQSEISAAFDIVKNDIDINNTDSLKQAIYLELKKTYKLNQAKFSTWEKFWANSNYEKHLQYLQSLVDMEQEVRAYAGTVSTYKSQSGNGGSGSGNNGGDGSDSGLPAWLIVVAVGAIVLLLIKKFKKK